MGRNLPRQELAYSHEYQHGDIQDCVPLSLPDIDISSRRNEERNHCDHIVARSKVSPSELRT